MESSKLTIKTVSLTKRINEEFLVSPQLFLKSIILRGSEI